MGTRGLIRLCDDQGQVYAIVYSQHDSYPRGLGAQLSSFLDGFTITNGLEMKAPRLYAVRKYTEFLNFVDQYEQHVRTDPLLREVLVQSATLARNKAQQRAAEFEFDNSSTLKQANGIGCLYAQLISHLKVTLGSIYLEPVSATNVNYLEEYIYEIRVMESGNITVSVTGHDMTGEQMDLDAFKTLTQEKSRLNLE